MKNKKTIAISLSALIVTALFAGCGTKKEEGKETQKKSGKTELTVWTRDSTVAAVKSAAEKYNAKQDKVIVNVVEQPASQMADQLSLALSSEEAPDIVSLDCTKVPYFASIGAFADITEKYETLEYKDTFSEGMLKSGQLEGKTYAVPFAPDVSVLLYNKDHYQNVGLDPQTPPATWEELIEYSQKLTTDEKYGYVYAGGDAGGHMFTFMPYVWNNGGEVLSEDGKTCELGEDNAVAALSMFNDLTNKYKVTPPSVTTYSWNEAQDAFLTEKLVKLFWEVQLFILLLMEIMKILIGVHVYFQKVQMEQNMLLFQEAILLELHHSAKMWMLHGILYNMGFLKKCK